MDTEIQFNDGGSLGASDKLTFNKTTGDLFVTNNVAATYFVGDGSKLTNIGKAQQIYALANSASGVSDYMVLKSLDTYAVGTQNTTTKTVTTTPTLLASYITDVGFPNITNIPVGDIKLEFDTLKASGPQSYYCYFEVYKRTTGGTETLIVTSENTTVTTFNTQIQQFANKYISTALILNNTDRLVVKIYAVASAGSPDISLIFDGAADGALTVGIPSPSIYSFVPYTNATGNVYLNSYSIIANTIVANSALVANAIIVAGRDLNLYTNAAFLAANTPSYVANSAASYANSAFLKANTPSDVANSAASYANSAFGKANSAFLTANTPSYTANSAALYANAAFTRANNSLDANNGGTVTGTITATSFITSGSFGNITGANTIYANNFVANTGYIQFADGSKQYTANAGSGGGASGNSFGVIYTANNNTFANATTANAQVNFVGESGVVVYANSITKTITVAGTPGAQGLTVDYGYVADPLYYAIDYGTL